MARCLAIARSPEVLVAWPDTQECRHTCDDDNRRMGMRRRRRPMDGCGDGDGIRYRRQRPESVANRDSGRVR